MSDLVVTTTESALSLVERALSDPNIDIQKLNGLLDFQLRVMDRQAEINFNRDFAQALQAMPKVSKKGVIAMGGKGSMTFAKYEDVDAAIRPIEEKYGFTRSFETSQIEGGINTTLRVSHKDGHCRTSSRLMPPDAGAGRNAMQAIGSASSYAKRYLTLDFWNIITVGKDDDGFGSGSITDAQVRQIEELLIDTNTEKAKFLKHLNVESIGKIQASRFQEAVSLLNQKAAMQKQSKKAA